MPEVVAPDSHNQPSPPAASRGHWFLRGLWGGVTSVQGAVLFASYIGFGGLCADIGVPLGPAAFSTFLIAALPSQLLLVGGYAAGTAPLVIALAVLLSAARLLPSVVTLLPYLRGKFWVQLFASHFIAVTVWVESRRLLPSLPEQARVPFFFGLITLFNISCVLATVTGFLLAGQLPRSLAIGLTFLTPISFLLALMRNSRDLIDYLALVFGLILAPIFATYGGKLDLLWTGLVGGGAAWLIHRWRKQARAT